MRGAKAGPAARQQADGRPWLGVGTRGRGSEPTAAPIWGMTTEEYLTRCDPWPLNPQGELLLGVKLESPEGIANCEAILRRAGPRLRRTGPGRPQPLARLPEHAAQSLPARDGRGARARPRGLPQAQYPFLEGATPENIAARIDEGVRVIAGHREDTAQVGRAHQRRTMPV